MLLHLTSSALAPRSINIQESAYEQNADTRPRAISTLINRYQEKELTFLICSKQSSRFMFLLRSLGRLSKLLATSMRGISCHLYGWYFLNSIWNFSDSCRENIHCSISRSFSLTFSDVLVTDCRYICFTEPQFKANKIYHATS